MTRLESLRALQEAVRAGTAGWYDFPRVCEGVWKEVGPNCTETARSAYHGSLDAALALHKAVLPGWKVKQPHQFEAGHWLAEIYHPQGEDWPKWTPYPSQGATADNPARAWLLAILSALIAQEQAQ